MNRHLFGSFFRYSFRPSCRIYNVTRSCKLEELKWPFPRKLRGKQDNCWEPEPGADQWKILKKKSGYFYLPKCIQRAKEGDEESIARLALAYKNGDALNNIEKDFEQSLHWLHQISHHTEVENEIGAMYLMGDGDKYPPDIDMAMEWFKKAADKEFPLAHLNIALCYRKGLLGFDYRKEKEIYHYEMAAYLGNPAAQYDLGVRYLSELQEYEELYLEKSFRFLEEALENGVVEANYMLGVLYHYYYEQPQVAARYYSERLKHSPHAPSAHYLSLLNYKSVNDDDTMVDLKDARKNCEIAALLNHVPAYQTMGELYMAREIGIEADYEKAEYWLLKHEKETQDEETQYILYRLYRFWYPFPKGEKAYYYLAKSSEKYPKAKEEFDDIRYKLVGLSFVCNMVDETFYKDPY